MPCALAHNKRVIDVTDFMVAVFVHCFWRNNRRAVGMRVAAIPKSEIAIMAYIITDTCTKDELCVEACPTDCIHPKKDEDGFEAATKLYVDPDGCIECVA